MGANGTPNRGRGNCYWGICLLDLQHSVDQLGCSTHSFQHRLHLSRDPGRPLGHRVTGQREGEGMQSTRGLDRSTVGADAKPGGSRTLADMR